MTATEELAMFEYKIEDDYDRKNFMQRMFFVIDLSARLLVYLLNKVMANLFLFTRAGSAKRKPQPEAKDEFRRRIQDDAWERVVLNHPSTNSNLLLVCLMLIFLSIY